MGSMRDPKRLPFRARPIRVPKRFYKGSYKGSLQGSSCKGS